MTAPFRAPFWLGVIVAVVMHRKNGWWLDEPRAAWQMVFVLTVGALGVSRLVAMQLRWVRSLELWVGFMIASTTILMVHVDANLFPIVILFGGAVSVAAVSVGCLIGFLLSKDEPFVRRQRQ